MTVGSSSPIVRRVSPSKSKFSKFKASLPFFKRNTHDTNDQDDISIKSQGKNILVLALQQIKMKIASSGACR